VLTYICVILIDFQAHRDAFIQNKIVKFKLDIYNSKIKLASSVFRDGVHTAPRRAYISRFQAAALIHTWLQFNLLSQKSSVFQAPLFPKVIKRKMKRRDKTHFFLTSKIRLSLHQFSRNSPLSITFYGLFTPSFIQIERKCWKYRKKLIDAFN